MEKETNYQLKSEAVETLAGADSAPAPEYSKEELERYKGKKKFKIPAAVKILFLKMWFYGAVCFFFLWGLGTYISDLLDMLFVVAIALGLVTDLLLNNVIRFLEAFPGEHEEWMLFPKKGMLSFFLNLVYGFALTFGVYLLYVLINATVMSLTGNYETTPLGVEPLLFGIFTMGVDMLFVGIKRLIVNIIEDAKYSAGKR